MRGYTWSLILAALAFVACSDDEDGPATVEPSADAGGVDGAPSDASTDGGDAGADATSGDDAGADADADAASATMTLTSSAFTAGGTIPVPHTCDGAGVSIPLAWSGAPAGTQSYAVVMRDLTLMGQPNYHWVIWDIPAATTSLPQGIPNTATPDPPGGGAKQAYWSFGAQYGYGNPAPSWGRRPTTTRSPCTPWAWPRCRRPGIRPAPPPWTP